VIPAFFTFIAAGSMVLFGGMYAMFLVAEPKTQWAVVPYTGQSFKHDGHGGCLNCGTQLGHHKRMTAECQR